MNQKSLERIVSQKALRIGSSFPCQICVLGFLIGVCLTSLFLAALTSLGTFELRGISYSAISQGNSPLNSSSSGFINTVANADCKSKRNEVFTERWFDSNGADDERVSLLHSAWSALLSESVDGGSAFRHGAGLDKSAVPNAPHLENCKLNEQTNERLDKRHENERLPPWTTWKGLLDTHPASMANEQIEYFRDQTISEGAYPPWITGSDEENYPVTRKVQRDIWLHQHPENCRDPNVRFLVAEWERLPGFGIGAQLVGMCGLLSIAISEKRVLVTSYYNRADHDGCKDLEITEDNTLKKTMLLLINNHRLSVGSYRSSWSCYFFPETSQECRDHAFELLGNKEALERGVITTKDSYKSKEIWNGRAPRQVIIACYGENPGVFCSQQQKSMGVWSLFIVKWIKDGGEHRKINTCSTILDEISNSVYVWLDEYCPKCCFREGSREDGSYKSRKRMAKVTPPSSNRILRCRDIEEFVWSNHRPWIPRPLLSMHVRMGDKAFEMKVVEFEDYMHLADRTKQRFPHLTSVWLSSEMQEFIFRKLSISPSCGFFPLISATVVNDLGFHFQEVIDKSKLYTNWDFYYTNVRRQVGNTTMAAYEASLGRPTSTNYPLVNFLMAAEADFFIGALGSTWCYLIDGMRNTGGKVMAGYLSVNKDRFW
ncbi:hypothetical protein DKX38_029087 [Salix brachista]|uniref:Uncharacterized protein n=1 Tax=Salix brachista TaxID=2182728 RepID=A0A5N5IY89_9ROSI|nr:hypothetical protein DKX38_029087 [Salix brachista]